MAESFGDTTLTNRFSQNTINLTNNGGSPQPVIKLNSENLSVVGNPISATTTNESSNIRTSINDGIQQKIRIANFIEESKIRLYGSYPQNFIDLPKYDLSNIVVINDSEVDFNFILSLRNNSTDAYPTLYATSKFYNSLLENYSNKKPIPVNEVINEKNIISINIQPLKDKVEELRAKELGQDINLTSSDNKKYVEVIRNLFSISNYKNEGGILKAEPSYDLIYLLRYISWVVSKPSQNYDDRILPVSELGQFGSYESTTTSTSEPPQNTTNTSTQTTAYPPIGRKGVEDEEEVYLNGSIYIWVDNQEKWFLQRPDNRD